MTTRSLFVFSVLGLMACGVGEPGSGAIGVVATALTSTCEVGAAPQGVVDRVQILVTGSDPDTRKIAVLADGTKAITASTQDVSLGDVPVGLDNVVTVLGFVPGQETPSWFGRRREVAVTQNRTTDVEMVLTRYGSFTCVGVPQMFPQLTFSSSVVLGDGRVLMTGGFTSATDKGDGTFKLGGASRSAYVYDPSKGELTEIAQMVEARAGHSMVYVPAVGSERVLIFGGTTSMTVKGVSFPLEIDANSSLDSYEIFDVATSTFALALKRDGNPDRMLQPRAFSTVGRLFDDTVLITGGGKWPLDDSNYNVAELWAPYANKDEAGENPIGGLLDLHGGLKLNSQHNGAAMVKLEDTSQGLSRLLVVGGTTSGDSVVEIFTQSSGQQAGASGAFRSVAVNGLPTLFFPAVMPVKETDKGLKRFLVAGGVKYERGKWVEPVANAWLLTVDSTDKVDTISAQTLDASPCGGMFFHKGSSSFEGDLAVLLGGYRDFSGVAKAGACFFDLATSKFSTPSALGKPDFFARAGHTVERLIDDTLLVTGGMVDAAGLSDGSTGLLELYTPPVLKTNLAQ